MYPTLSNGDRLIISKIARTSSKITKNTFEPDRGEIIVFVDPIQPDLQLIKRVIGLPGERVVVANQKLLYTTANIRTDSTQMMQSMAKYYRQLVAIPISPCLRDIYL